MLSKCRATITERQFFNNLCHQADLPLNNLQTAANSTELLFRKAERAYSKAVEL